MTIKTISILRYSLLKHLALFLFFLFILTFSFSCSGSEIIQSKHNVEENKHESMDDVPITIEIDDQDIKKEFSFSKSDHLTDKGNEDKTSGRSTNEKIMGLGTDQSWLVSIFGYPDEFMIIFTEEEDSKKIECWQYVDMQSYYTFYNGKFIDSDIYISEDFESDSVTLKPQDLKYGMTPDETAATIGGEPNQIIKLENGYEVYSFKDGLVICTFNLDGALIGINRLKKVSGNI